MYAGYVDGRLLFAVGMDGYEITSGTIHQALGECDSADFKLPASNTMRDVPVKRASIIDIRKDGKTVFKGCVVDTSTDFYGNRTYNIDGAMMWLADICKPPFVMTEDTVTYYATALLAQYNAACLATKQIKLGNIDAALPNLAAEQTEYKSMLALLQDAMQAVGGTMRIRYDGDDIYLDCIQSYNHRCSQRIEIGKNLLDLADKMNGADLITRVYPIGKDGLTIASVNGGVAYLVNATAEALYGRIDGTLRVDTDDAAALKAAAATYLAQNCGLSRGIQVSAADLSGTDITLEPYHIGDSVRVGSPPHGIDTIMTVSKLDTSLVGGKDTMTLGWGSKTLTGAVASGGSGSSGGPAAASGGWVEVDSALSKTSTNPVQNKVVKAALDGKLPTSGGTLTGNLTGKYITGTWLQTTAATDLGRVPGKIAVLDESGWVYYRTPAELKSDIAASASGADCIESQGTTGVWTWRKWASGIAEMWAVFGADTLAMTAQTWGDLYTASWMGMAINKSARQYPFAFVDQPVVTATPIADGANFWCATNTENDTGTSLTHAPAYQCVRASDATLKNPRISYYVIGKYK